LIEEEPAYRFSFVTIMSTRLSKALKERMQRERIFREMKLRSYYENPLKGKRGRRWKPFAAPASSRARRCSAKACGR
jgi:ribosomal protein S21